ncbi:MAG: alanine racemase [Deltaproteobacteria bacterium]|nr:alanine racemase [Deltaproteobacteria bacterium]MBW1718037.1 alanine racemase [Deltaproteobacteria bacterium]MBW1937231.1 alanine racemase [Deltaproteobacteria bacterium]MBW1963846.1 alanine racemase [Deltaproteobacteria bacterium]MBW2079626.1 alanine racemase [Deltaproteobacteria bacterium]
MSYTDLNRIEIDLTAVSHNFTVLKGLLKSTGARIMAVIKSDAYGHGLLEISQVLESAGVWGFGVSDVEEAISLRKGKITAPILFLSGLPPGAEKEVMALGLIPGVTDVSSLYTLERVASMRDETCRVHLKVDTGMGRLGFSPDELYGIVKELHKWPHLCFEGLYSHLSSADDPLDPFNTVQLNTFASVLDRVKEMGWKPLTIHMANSAGLIHFPPAHYDLVRPGLAIYGSYPGPQSQKSLELRPVMSFRSKIVAIRNLAERSPVSYGHSFYTKRPSRIAVLPVGYDDGYLRSMSNRSIVLIRGRRCPVVGSICMKSFMVDVSTLDEVTPGEEAVLLGRQGDEIITAEDLAQWGSTISYELLCLLGSRNKRFFRDNQCLA